MSGLILPRCLRSGLILPQSQRGFMLVNPYRFGGGAVDPTALSIYNKIVAWWDHSGSVAPLADSGSGGYTQVSAGGAGTTTADSTAIASGLGTCIHANNSGMILNAAHATALNLNNDFSIMQWFQRDAGPQPTFPKLLGKYTDEANGKATYALFVNTSTNKVIFRFNSAGNYYDATGATSISSGVTYCAIGTKLTTGSEFYLNNALDATQASGGTPDTGTSALRNGAVVGNDSLVGYFSVAALFSPALTSTERAYLYNSGNGVSYAALAAAAGH